MKNRLFYRFSTYLSYLLTSTRLPLRTGILTALLVFGCIIGELNAPCKVLADDFSGAKAMGEWSVDNGYFGEGNARAPESDTSYLMGHSTDRYSIVPHSVIGWSNALGENKKWSINIGLGVVSSGSPADDSVGMNVQTFFSDIRLGLTEDAKINGNEPGSHKSCPVIAMGITYKF